MAPRHGKDRKCKARKYKAREVTYARQSKSLRQVKAWEGCRQVKAPCTGKASQLGKASGQGKARHLGKARQR
jgi:hypothetical protein